MLATVLPLPKVLGTYHACAEGNLHTEVKSMALASLLVAATLCSQLVSQPFPPAWGLIC